MVVFGALWFSYAIYATGANPRLYTAVAAMGGILLFFTAMQSRRPAVRDPLASQTLAEERLNRRRALGSRFLLVNITQYALIALVVVLGIALAQPTRIAGAIEAVVGAHFFPLARLFVAPLYYVTGTVMLLFGVVSAVVATDAAVLMALLSAGTTLWLTTIILVLTY